jgi:O-antigen/teichoic acid export membrane protein
VGGSSIPSDRRATKTVRWLLGHPTWLAQTVNALSSLLLVALLTRSLSADDFAIYATVLATYAFGNALVGTTIGTRAIEALSAGGRTTIALHPRRDVPPIVGCMLAAAATTLVTRVDPGVALAAAGGMLGILVAELGGAHPLGLRRYWTYALLTLAQMTVWVGAAMLALTTLPSSERLPGCLGAVALGALPFVVYLAAVRGLTLAPQAPSRDRHSPVSAVGVANLALWLLASGDRVILAHYALTALATYAALYGLLDRVFRTVANAEIQQRLPRAFIGHAQKGRSRSSATLRGAVLLLLLGAICAVAGPTAIAIISGGHYHPSIAMSTVLSLAMVAMLAAVPSYVSLIARGDTRVVATVALGAAAVNILGNLALAGRYGTSSATGLTLVGYLIWLGGVTTAERRVRSPSTSPGPIPSGSIPSRSTPYPVEPSSIAYVE